LLLLILYFVYCQNLPFFIYNTLCYY